MYMYMHMFMFMTFHNGIMFVLLLVVVSSTFRAFKATSLLDTNRLLYVIANRHRLHNIREGLMWVQTSHNTSTCTISLHVKEL